MKRFLWKGSLAASLLCAGIGSTDLFAGPPPSKGTKSTKETATAQANSENIITLKTEKGERKCVIVSSKKQTDGTIVHQVKALDNGETFTLMEAANSKVPSTPTTAPAAPKTTAATPSLTIPLDNDSIPSAENPPKIVDNKAPVAMPKTTKNVELPKVNVTTKSNVVPPTAVSPTKPPVVVSTPVPASKPGLFSRLFGRASNGPTVTTPTMPMNKTTMPLNQTEQPPLAIPDHSQPKGTGPFSQNKMPRSPYAPLPSKTVVAETSKPMMTDSFSMNTSSSSDNVAPTTPTSPTLPLPVPTDKPVAMPTSVISSDPPGSADVGTGPVLGTPTPNILPSSLQVPVNPVMPTRDFQQEISEVSQWKEALKDALQPSHRELAAESLCKSLVCQRADVREALLTAIKQDPAVSVRMTCLRCLVNQGIHDEVYATAIASARQDQDAQVRELAKQLSR